MQNEHRNAKYISQSSSEQVRFIMPHHLNGGDTLFGGQLVQWIDELAGIVARRHCCSRVTTASIDNLRFREPAYLGDLVVLRAALTYVGNSSMEVRVDSYAESQSGESRLINTAFLIMVCLDEEGRPARAPQLKFRDRREEQAAEAAKKRRALQKQIVHETEE